MAKPGVPSAPTRASDAIPLVSRLMLLYIEPFLAFCGALLVLVNAPAYLSSMTRGTLTTGSPDLRFIFTELAGGWLHLAFTEAVVLRLVDDVRVWRLLCTGLLLSDLAYTHSCAEAVGGWEVWLRVWEWTREDWLIAVTTWPFVFARLGIVSGLTLRGPGVKGKM